MPFSKIDSLRAEDPSKGAADLFGKRTALMVLKLGVDVQPPRHGVERFSRPRAHIRFCFPRRRTMTSLRSSDTIGWRKEFRLRFTTEKAFFQSRKKGKKHPAFPLCAGQEQEALRRSFTIFPKGEIGKMVKLISIYLRQLPMGSVILFKRHRKP